MIRLADVAVINPGFDRSGVAPEEPVSFAAMSDVSEVLGSIVSEQSRRFAEVSSGFTAFQDGDVLVAKITPCFENGKIAHARIRKRFGFGSTEFHVVRPNVERLDDRYLYHYLRRPEVRAAGQRRMTGSAGQRRVPKAFLEDLAVPLLPLREQRRIAAILDKTDALRAKRREAIAKLDQLLQSVFIDMFGDPVTNPKRWVEKEIGDIAHVQGGLQLMPSRGRLPVRVPYLRVANVLRACMDLSEIKEMGVTHEEVLRTALRKGDILIVEGHGNPLEIGRCAIWDGPIERCSHQNHLIRARVDESKVTPQYLSFFLNSEVGSRGLRGVARTTSGLNTISVSKVRGTRVLVPPIEFQRRWGAVLGKVQSQHGRHVAATTRTTALFESLRIQAFANQL